jgi:hypothetical protein
MHFNILLYHVVLDVSLPRHPGTYLVVTYSTNGTRLPYYLNNYGSMYLELEYLKQATLMGDLDDPHRGNSSMLCYQHWLRPFNTTTLGEWMFLQSLFSLPSNIVQLFKSLDMIMI